MLNITTLFSLAHEPESTNLPENQTFSLEIKCDYAEILSWTDPQCNFGHIEGQYGTVGWGFE